MGSQRHQWISPKKKEGGSVLKKQLAELFPHLRDDDLDVLASISTKKDLDDYVKDHGNDIKK